MRNLEKDAALMAERKERLLETGFRLFSENSIERTNLLQVTEAARVGTVTIYRYYENKPCFVVAVLAWKWEAYLRDAYRRFEELDSPARTAAEQYAFYLNEFERLYREHKPLLRLNENFTTYARHEGMSREQLQPLMDYLLPMLQRLHGVFLRGEQDGTLRTELGEEQLVIAALHTMLAVVGKYAGGLLYAGESEERNLREIRFLIETFRKTCTREAAER